MLRGGNELFARCKEKLKIENRETTPDGLFSLEEVECIGACSWAPAVQVNYDFHENLTPESLDALLDQYRTQNGLADRGGR
jgi:NADH-quinone oxidoreductase subunit E